MNKSETTLMRLEAALERILTGATIRIKKHRKLSIRAVEEEANLGNGSCYYYSDFSCKVKSLKTKRQSIKGARLANEELVKSVREKTANEKRIKEKYRAENLALKNIIKQLSAEHHQLNDLIRRYKTRSEKLQEEINELYIRIECSRDDLAQLKRQNLFHINKGK